MIKVGHTGQSNQSCADRQQLSLRSLVDRSKQQQANRLPKPGRTSNVKKKLCGPDKGRRSREEEEVSQSFMKEDKQQH